MSDELIDDCHQVAEFLAAIWGNGPHSVNWGHPLDYVHAATPADVLPLIDKLQHVDTWIGAHPLSHVPEQGRGLGVDVLEVVAIPADLDWAHETRRTKKPLPTEPEVRDRIRRLGPDLQPSIVVHSGHGLQAWWLLDRPISPADAEQLIGQFDAAFAAVGLENGRPDLASILRLPGTRNHKGEVLPVVIESMRLDWLHVPEYLAKHLPAATAVRATSGGTKHRRGSVTDDQQALLDFLVVNHGAHGVDVWSDGSIHVVRPDKLAKDGSSASIIVGEDGDALLTVFSDNWTGLAEGSFILGVGGKLHHPGDPLAKFSINVPPPSSPAAEPTKVTFFRTADQYKPDPAKQLIRGWLPHGELCMLAGKPGVGKGVIAADIVARGTRGKDMPNGDRLMGAFRSAVVCMPGEDSGEEWRRRLEVAGAELDQVLIADSYPDQGPPIGATTIAFVIEGLVRQGAKLIVVDALTGLANSAGLDVNKAEVRNVLDPLSDLARRHGVVILIFHHVRKADGDPLDVAAGNSQIAAAVRSSLIAVEERVADGREPDVHLFGVAKLNNAKRSSPVGYRIVGRSLFHPDGQPRRDDRSDVVKVPAVEWITDRTFTQGQLIAACNKTVLRTLDRDQAATDILSAGPIKSAEYIAEMGNAGFSEQQAKDARTKVGGGTFQHGKQWWSHPGTMSTAAAKQAVIALDDEQSTDPAEASDEVAE